MPKWIVTKSLIIDYGWESDSKGGFLVSRSTHIKTPMKRLRERLREIEAKCDEEQFTIKGVTPIADALIGYDYSTGSNGSYGYGYGATQIRGFVVFLQKEEELTFEEYTRRNNISKINKKITSIGNKIEELKASVATQSKISTEISEKKKLLGSNKYEVASKEFSSMSEAQEFVAQHQANITKLEADIKSATDDMATMLTALSSEIEMLEDKEWAIGVDKA